MKSVPGGVGSVSRVLLRIDPAIPVSPEQSEPGSDINAHACPGPRENALISGRSRLLWQRKIDNPCIFRYDLINSYTPRGVASGETR